MGCARGIEVDDTLHVEGTRSAQRVSIRFSPYVSDLLNLSIALEEARGRGGEIERGGLDDPDEDSSPGQNDCYACWVMRGLFVL